MQDLKCHIMPLNHLRHMALHKSVLTDFFNCLIVHSFRYSSIQLLAVCLISSVFSVHDTQVY